MEATTTLKRRRTQAERTAATRARLLVSTIECLVDHGYVGTTTTRIAERAGVSRGAQLHHFPTRAELVAAAAEHMFASLTAEYRHAFEGLVDEASLGAAIELLWSMYDRPSFAAVIELHTAARSDAELLACLAPVAERHRSNVVKLAARYFPALAGDAARFEAVLMLVTNAMHGMIAARLVHGRDAAAERVQLGLLEAAVNILIAPSHERGVDAPEES